MKLAIVCSFQESDSLPIWKHGTSPTAVLDKKQKHTQKTDNNNKHSKIINTKRNLLEH